MSTPTNVKIFIKEDMDEILYALCRHNISIMDGWHPLPATIIADVLDVSVHKVRRHLRQLKKQGFVNDCHEGGQTEDGQVYCYWGWTITDKALNTNEYKKAHDEERELCKKCFNIDIGEAQQFEILA